MSLVGPITWCDVHKMSEDYLNQLRREEQDLTSQYTNEEKLDINDYKTIVNAGLSYAPERGERLSHYHDRLGIFIKLAAEKNRKTHIDGPRKAWYTHRSPMGCFMCEDMNMYHVLFRVLGLLVISYPDYKF